MCSFSSDSSGKIKTSMGFTVTPFVYACLVSLSITLGSVIIMFRLGIPWWGWAIQYIILTAISYGVVRRNMDQTSEGAYVVINRRKLILFALIVAIFMVLTAITMRFI